MNTRLATCLLLSLLTCAARAGSQKPTDIPAADRAGLHAAYEAARHEVRAEADGALAALNPGQQWRTRFDGRGFTVTPAAGGWTWGLELRRYGFPGAERAVGEKARVSHAQGRVAYDWDATLREWFVNDTRGLEQGWTFHERPAGAAAGGPLRVELAIRGGLQAEVAHDGASVSYRAGTGAAALTFSGLKAWDADGQALAVRFEPAAEGTGFIRVAVEEAGARYPVTVDPVAQQAYLKASNTDAGDEFGAAVDISGDTIVIGAPSESSSASGVDGSQTNNDTGNSGAAYVFVRNGTTWIQQAYLKASNPGPVDFFGNTVAISGDTIVVGAVHEDSGTTGVNGNENDESRMDNGAAYVFVRSGGMWTQQAYLKAPRPQSATTVGTRGYAPTFRFGKSVDIDGDTIVVCAPTAHTPNGALAEVGAAFVYVRTGTTWSVQAELSGSRTLEREAFGADVAISANTIAVSDTAGTKGSVYVFSRDGTTWTEQAYIPSPNAGLNDFFYSVALSGDTLIVGASAESSALSFAGAAYVFVRIGTSWSQQAKLTAPQADENDRFGINVAISGDTAIVTSADDSSATGIDGDQTNNDKPASGAAYAYQRSGSTWTLKAYIKASNPDQEDGFGGTLGQALAISGDTAVIGAVGEDSAATGVDGGEGDNSRNRSGAAYVFSQADIDRDSDGDGLLDRWESPGKGIDVDGDGIIDLDLYAKGARPDRKDLFVEVDFEPVGGRARLQQALEQVFAAFSFAPVQADNNPANKGIFLQVDIDEGDLASSGAEPNASDGDYPLGFAATKAKRFGTAAERASINSENILKAKALAYRYCFIYKAVKFSPGSFKWGGIAEIGGNDFMIDATTYFRPSAPIEDLAAVFMHEFGHCLNLRHGGGDDVNFKPNYPSIMNYSFNYRKSWSRDFWLLNFSGEKLPTLVENNLNELVGIPSMNYQTFALPYGFDAGTGVATVSLDGFVVDYDSDTKFEASVQADVNYFGPMPVLASFAPDPSPGETLESFNDWANILYKVNPDNTDAGASVVPSEGCGNEQIRKFLEENVSVTAATFEDWVQKFIGIGTETDYEDDPDGDGLVNGVERYLGTHPLFKNKGLTVNPGGNFNGFRHSRTLQPGADTQIAYEWSTDLTNWHASGASSDGVTVTLTPTRLGPGRMGDLIEVLPQIDGSPAGVFFRIAVAKTGVGSGTAIAGGPPVTPAGASYSGLFNVEQASDGYGTLQLKTTARRRATGAIQINGKRKPIKASFDAQGVATQRYTVRSGGQTITQTLVLRLTDDGATVEGDFSDGAGGVHLHTGGRNLTGKKSAPVAQAGAYTSTLAGTNVGGAAEVRGWFTLSVKPTGKARLVGALPDGTKLSLGTNVTTGGAVPVGIGLYKNKLGYLLGQLAIDADNRSISGLPTWFKPAGNPEPLASVPRHSLTAFGLPYVKPDRGERAVEGFDANDGAALADLTLGNLAADILDKAITIGTDNKIAIATPGDDKLALAIAPGTGVLTGSFIHSDGAKRKISGVLLQQTPTGVIEGFFPGTTLPGVLRITPTP